MKRKYPKIHKEPLGSLTSDREGASPPLDSPSNTPNLRDKRRGNVTKWLWGKGNVLDSIKTEFYVIAPKNETSVPFFEIFCKFDCPRGDFKEEVSSLIRLGVGCIAPHNKLPVPKNSTHLLGRYERYKPTKSFVKKTGLEPLLQTLFGMRIIPLNIIWFRNLRHSLQ